MRTTVTPFLIRSTHVLPGILLACMLLPVIAQAQSREELKTLFFDPVYVDDPEQILLTSGRREGVGDADTRQQVLPPARLPGEILEDIRRYEASIGTLIENNGIYDPVLAQEYLATGQLYEQLGDRENAVGAYENAMHINRVNQGLFTLDQTEAVRALIDSNMAYRNYQEVDKYQQYLYYLKSQNLDPDSDELVTAALEFADWNLEAFRRMTFLNEDGLSISGNFASAGATMLRQGELIAIEDDQFSELMFVPRSAMLSSPSAVRMQSFTPEQLIDPRLKQAEDIFDKLLESNPDNLELLRRKANITFLFKSQLEQYVSFNTIGSTISLGQNRVLRNVSVLRRGYANTRDDLLDLAMSLEADDPVKAAQIYLDIGDWDLVFERQNRAQETYNKAREILLAQGLSETDITEFVTPEPALLIPGFATYEFTRSFHNLPETTDIAYIGYIDVSFEKRPNGSLRRINIENASENTGLPVRDRLQDMLRTALMRPLFIAGETVPQSDIKVRYYYAY